ncbi:rhodanese-like domain-containing protein [Croceitalea rosinachiae]|uniref:Rhodanese-like domain-containing protein n=1 Tax=Croceitalea rosinachiae TaxID=3075596 RepID=A0ABU3A6Y4_9FLAO|nr:rhodanese-like domain-containing protein [Croceitalea sp. F388]MDT0605936.1 rhodanese-like domain-containing protein [Croceitalea sp. F388]
MRSLLTVISLVVFFSCALSCQEQPKKQVNKESIIVINKAMLKAEVIGKKVQLVDVRTPEEYEAGHIGNAVNYNIINSESFLKQIDHLDKDAPIYLYCKMGGRSNRAAKLLEENGFTKLYDYSGGYNDWVTED